MSLLGGYVDTHSVTSFCFSLSSTKQSNSGIGKVKSFTLNATKKPILSKKELERQKLMEDREAEAVVLQQFVDTFEKPATNRISFVKGSDFNAGNGSG